MLAFVLQIKSNTNYWSKIACIPVLVMSGEVVLVAVCQGYANGTLYVGAADAGAAMREFSGKMLTMRLRILSVDCIVCL